MKDAANRPAPAESEPTDFLPAERCRVLSCRVLSRPYWVGRTVAPATRPVRALLAALLHVGPDELLGVLLEHLVDLVQDRVHVVGQGLMTFLDVLGALRGGLLGLLAAPGRLPLPACVLCRHCLPPFRGAIGLAQPDPCCLNAIFARQ